ncbi:MAG: hypothetical protein IT391_01570 [Nitrospira sp.]|nr:hypothetical protein [Nitrospira sp.]
MIETLFPIHRPVIGLSLRANALSMVRVKRRPFCQSVVSSADQRALAPGILAPAATGLNIGSTELLGDELRALVGPGRDRAVAVSLPDEIATMGLWSFETLPVKAGEREALIRWRIRQEIHGQTGNERLLYRVYSGGASLTVLAACLDEAVFMQYASMLAGANVLAASIGFETLQLFEIFRRTMQFGPEAFFVHHAGGALTCIAIRAGQPIFMRRCQVNGRVEGARGELVGTLQYYFDRFPQSSLEGSLRSPLYYVETAVRTEPDTRLFCAREIVVVPALSDTRSVEIIPCDWSTASIRTGAQALPASFLPAVASLGVA